MTTSRISALPLAASVTDGTDYVPVVVAAGPTTKKTLVSTLTAGAIASAVSTVASNRYTASDSNTLLRWKLGEAAAPFASDGTNVLPLTVTLGAVTPSAVGMFGDAVCFDLSASATGVLGSANTTVEPAVRAATISAWVKVTTFTASGIIVAKAYSNTGSYSAPFNAMQISLGPSADGSWGVGVTTGGTRTLTSITSPKLPQCQWVHLALTWDGTNLLSYMNGEQTSATVIAFGPNDIDFGTHGPWNIGNTGTATAGGLNAVVDDVRVESVVRSKNYLRALWKAGIGLS